jgi:hypothetical protein
VRLRSRQFLIVVETALALLLVAGAGLMLRSFHELLAIGVGFDTTRLATVDIANPAKRYPGGQSKSRFFHALIDRARSIPGFTAAGAINNLPLHQVQISNFFIAGWREPPRKALKMADFAHVSLEYFSTIGFAAAQRPLSYR